LRANPLTFYINRVFPPQVSGMTEKTGGGAKAKPAAFCSSVALCQREI
jgi:hypothetical protein